MTSNRAKGVEAAQGLIAIAGVTFGVIPMIGLTIGFGPSGLFDRIFGDPSTSTSWVIAIAILVIAIVAVLGLERARPSDER